MSRRHDIDTSYELEERLRKSIQKVGDKIRQSRTLKRKVQSLRYERRKIEPVSDEVKEWFEETGEYLEE